MSLKQKCIALLLAPVMLAQGPVPEGSGSPNEIIVTGRPNSVIQGFVEKMTNTPGAGQIARWNTGICPQVLGFDDAHDIFIEDSLRNEAATLKVRNYRGECEPNVIIVGVHDADSYSAAFAKGHSWLFADRRYRTSSTKQIEAFERSRPVRWVATTEEMSADGVPVGGEGLRRTVKGDGSRLGTFMREDAFSTVVIVDGAKLAGVNWAQLADYLKLVVFLRPQLDSDVHSADTIANLFLRRDDGRPLPSGLTMQDRDLLQAVYGTGANQEGAAQRADIRREMQKKRAERTQRGVDDHDD